MFKYLLIIILTYSSILAQWPTSPDSAILIGLGKAKQVVEDGQGGVYIVHGDYDGLCTRINHDGVKVWGNVGLDGVYSEQPHQSAALASDGSLLVSYRDILYIGGWDWGDAHIRVQKISPDGEKLWGEGVVVTPDNASGPDDYNPYIYSFVISDDSGGAYVVWEDFRNNVGGFRWAELYIQRINAEGQVLWDSLGVLVDSYILGVKLFALTNESLPLIIYFRDENQNWVTQQYLQKYDENGSANWIERGPMLVGGGGHGVTLDQNDNLFVTSDEKIFKFNTDYDPIWPEDGIVFSDSLYRVWDIISDGLGGAILQYGKDDSTNRYFTQWIDDQGQLKFGPSGLFVTKIMSDDVTANMSDTASFIVAYQPIWGAEKEYIGQRVDSDGNLLWEEEALLANYNNSFHYYPRAIPDGEHGIIYVYDIDSRTYVTQLGSEGYLGSITSTAELNSILPDELRLNSVYPNPFNSSLAIQYELNTNDLIHTDLYNLQGKYIMSAMHYGKSGSNKLTIDFSTIELPSGIYLVDVWADSSPRVKHVSKATYLK